MKYHNCFVVNTVIHDLKQVSRRVKPNGNKFIVISFHEYVFDMSFEGVPDSIFTKLMLKRGGDKDNFWFHTFIILLYAVFFKRETQKVTDTVWRSEGAARSRTRSVWMKNAGGRSPGKFPGNLTNSEADLSAEAGGKEPHAQRVDKKHRRP
jgi:hypothetical protein